MIVINYSLSQNIYRFFCPRGSATSLGGPAGHGRPARKGLDEACAELCKACLPFPPVTRMSRKDSHRDVTRYELNCSRMHGE